MKIFTNEILSEEEERISAEFDATDDTPVDPDDPIYSGGYEIPLEQRHFKD